MRVIQSNRTPASRHEEIEQIIADAHQMRAQAIAEMVRSLFYWLVQKPAGALGLKLHAQRPSSQGHDDTDLFGGHRPLGA